MALAAQRRRHGERQAVASSPLGAIIMVSLITSGLVYSLSNAILRLVLGKASWGPFGIAVCLPFLVTWKVLAYEHRQHQRAKTAEKPAEKTGETSPDTTTTFVETHNPLVSSRGRGKTGKPKVEFGSDVEVITRPLTRKQSIAALHYDREQLAEVGAWVHTHAHHAHHALMPIILIIPDHTHTHHTHHDHIMPRTHIPLLCSGKKLSKTRRRRLLLSE
jgi:hypothetical protein